MENQNDQEPARYEAEYVTRQVLFAQTFIKKLNLRGYEHLLDLGCGRGYLTACLAQVLKAGQVVGIDTVTDVIQLARETYRPVSYPNLKFWQMDIETFDLHGRFDIVVSNGILHWLEDHTVVLSNIRRHLVPQGKIFIRLKGKGYAADLCMVIKQTAVHPDWQPYFQELRFPNVSHGAGDYEAWLPACGFAPKRIELLSKQVFFEDVHAFQIWLRMTWFRLVPGLSLEQQQPFWRLITEAYLDVCPLDRHGRVLVEDVTLEVEAVVV